MRVRVRDRVRIGLFRVFNEIAVLYVICGYLVFFLTVQLKLFSRGSTLAWEKNNRVPYGTHVCVLAGREKLINAPVALKLHTIVEWYSS